MPASGGSYRLTHSPMVPRQWDKGLYPERRLPATIHTSHGIHRLQLNPRSFYMCSHIKPASVDSYLSGECPSVKNLGRMQENARHLCYTKAAFLRGRSAVLYLLDAYGNMALSIAFTAWHCLMRLGEIVVNDNPSIGMCANLGRGRRARALGFRFRHLLVNLESMFKFKNARSSSSRCVNTCCALLRLEDVTCLSSCMLPPRERPSTSLHLHCGSRSSYHHIGNP